MQVVGLRNSPCMTRKPIFLFVEEFSETLEVRKRTPLPILPNRPTLPCGADHRRQAIVYDVPDDTVFTRAADRVRTGNSQGAWA
jgi:hypothetical protein